MTNERVHPKGDGVSGRSGDRLGLEVDGHLRPALGRAHEPLQLRAAESHRDEPDLDRVREEDVPERRRDHDFEAVVL